MLLQCWGKFNQGPRKLQNVKESTSKNVSSEWSKKGWKGFKQAQEDPERTQREGEARSQSEAELVLFPCGFPGSIPEMEGACRNGRNAWAPWNSWWSRGCHSHAGSRSFSSLPEGGLDSAKMWKYQSNPKVMNLTSKLSAKLGGQAWCPSDKWSPCWR